MFPALLLNRGAQDPVGLRAGTEATETQLLLSHGRSPHVHPVGGPAKELQELRSEILLSLPKDAVKASVLAGAMMRSHGGSCLWFWSPPSPQ